MQNYIMSKIIVTVGPSSINQKTLERLKKAGASSFRINLSHSNDGDLERYFNLMGGSKISPSIDTQGAQLRISKLSINGKLSTGSGVSIRFDIEKIEDNEQLGKSGNIIWFNHPEVSEQFNIGDVLKLDFDGLLIELIKKNKDNSWQAKVIAEGSISINRAVDVQNKTLEMNPLTKFDLRAIDYALKKGCKEVYASFISSKYDIMLVREKVRKDVKVISKIETARGVANAGEIIESSDAILIDRGDLSREISISAIPIAVESVIKIAKGYGKPVYIATNILDSMMKSKLPSRAEISDIYTLLRSGVDGIVLAAEVAIGSNPVESTALLEYLIRLYKNHKLGLHGIGEVRKPPTELIGEQLQNWL